jgi:methyl-accepting chemotaxis protein
MRLLLPVISIIMVVIGIVGLISSFFAFGGVTSQLGNIDASVTNVVSLLNNASSATRDTEKFLIDAGSTLGNVEKQVPSLVDSSATTLETASKAISEARGGAALAEKWISDLDKGMALQDVKARVKDTREGMSNSAIVMTGQELINWAPTLAAYLGMDESMLVSQGQLFIAENRNLIIPLKDQVAITGDDLIGISQFLEDTFAVDASGLRYNGEAAKLHNHVWGFHIVETLKRVEHDIDQVDGQVKQVRLTVNNTGKQLDVLSTNLGSNAQNVRGTKANITNAISQVEQFLGVANKQVGQIGKDLSSTAQSLGQVSASKLVGSAISGLRWYMVFTNILFIAAGVGLFEVNRRLKALSRA